MCNCNIVGVFQGEFCLIFPLSGGFLEVNLKFKIVLETPRCGHHPL